MLTIKNLSAGYGGPIIIHDVALEVGEGQIVTIIGPNGAGKSTVLRSIFGLTQIEKGSSIFFHQNNLIGLPTSETAERGICYVPQGRSIFPTMSVEENLEMGAYIRKNKEEIRENMEYVYEKFPRLYERRHQKTKTLSGGEQQMVAFGRALMLKPELLLLDEPSIGLAPKVVADIFEKLLEIRKDGTAILMVEQNAHMALEISDVGYVLELGRNKLHGPGKELLQDDRIAEAYLGKISGK
ncbi:ABC transporter ATP-binding protein [Candidatus Peregrinibacteria bacterium CG11_big_fil_rev_8_21_14_0_20_46_8]|nr:MAG: ABC transporter ATP-binding protein [Candidatus Peregrinibacteria bacterium CG11_big_fil_rev_8_21_14_0_20_46_8]